MKKNTNYGSHAQDKHNKPAPTPRFGDVRFVNYSLPDPVRQSLKEKPFTPDQALKALLDLNDAGYSVKFKYDGKYQNYSVFLQHTDPDHANTGIILAGRGSSPEKALKQACFIHYEVTQGQWQGFVDPYREPVDD